MESGISLNIGLNISQALYRSYDNTLGRWWQVDPEAEQFYGMSPYTEMGNNPVNAADPNGDISIYIIPNISFNKGGINIGIEFGIGVPGVSNLSFTGGISLGRGGGVQPYWSVQAGLGGGYAGYGSGGSFGGLGPFGWTQGGGWSVNVPIINSRAGGASGGFGLSYGENGWDWSASARYTHQGKLDLSRPSRKRIEESLDVEPEPINPNLLACNNCPAPAGAPDPRLQQNMKHAVSLEEWRKENEGKSLRELRRKALNRGRYRSQSGGPKSRYVVDPVSGGVIDMRHFIIVGMEGKLVGDLVEEYQYCDGQESGRNPQDYFSNNLGYRFYRKHRKVINLVNDRLIYTYSFPNGVVNDVANFLINRDK